MAEIVLGIGTSHSPQMSFPAAQWGDLGKADQKSPHLLDPQGRPISYIDLLEQADPNIAAHELTTEVFTAKFERLQHGLRAVTESIRAAKPDVVIIVGDDQEENIGFDNMPSLMVYWGDEIPSVPRMFTENPFPTIRMAAWSYGSEERSYPVASDLGKHVIEHMTEHGFDVAQS